MSWETALLAAMYLAVAGGAYDCARLTKEDRNYYPMQRVIWSAFAFFGTLAGVGALMGRPNTTGVRLTFAAVLLLAILYSDWFMRRRNRTARYIPLRVDGQPDFIDVEVLRRKSEIITSVVYHGDAPADWVDGLEEACAHWREVQHFRAAAEQRNAARRRARGGE